MVVRMKLEYSLTAYTKINLSKKDDNMKLEGKRSRTCFDIKCSKFSLDPPVRIIKK